MKSFDVSIVRICWLAMALAIGCDNPVEPPEPLVLDAPNNAAAFYVGDTMEIRWTLNDSIAGLQIELSVNNGGRYTQIAAFFGNDPEIADGRYLWIIPDTVGTLTKQSTLSDSCRIFIHDYFDYTIGDASNEAFSIRNR